MIREYMGPDGAWRKPPLSGNSLPAGKPWNPVETDAWTDQSHLLAGEAAYPPGAIIRADFAEKAG